MAITKIGTDIIADDAITADKIAAGALDTQLAGYLSTNSFATETYVGTTVTNAIAPKWTQDNTKISNWDTAYGWGDHSTATYATQSYVGTALSNLVDSSPATLDTLNELAAALGDDPNFATTTATAIGLKAPIASPNFTGTGTIDRGTSAGSYLIGGSNTRRQLIISSGTGDASSLDALHDFNASGVSGVLSFSTNSAERVRITSEGKVGINVSSPATVLHVSNVSTAPAEFRLENSEGYGEIGTNSNLFEYAALQHIFYAKDKASEYGRFDASGNLLVGKTAASTTTLGVEARANGLFAANKSGGASGYFGRQVSDGNIVEFNKDGTTVGSIGVKNGNNLTVGGAVADHSGIEFGTQQMSPLVAGVGSDGTVDLGTAALRFKDLYLSSKIMIGTGSSAAATINAYSATVATNLFSALRVIDNTGASSYWDIGATGGTSTKLNFYHNANTSPKMTLESNGNLVVSGAVGVGYTPNSWFANRTAIQLGNSVGNVVASGDELHIGTNFYNKVGTAVDTITSTGFFSTDFAQRAGIFTWSSTAATGTAEGNVSFVERMRIDTSGNVGIGTNAPVTSLSFGEASTGITFLSTATNFNSGKVAGIRGEVSGTGHGNLAFDTFAGGSGGGERMMIRYDGNVGIGTDAPSGLLDIKGNFESVYALKFNNTQGTDMVSGFRSHGGNGEAFSFYHDGDRRQMWDSNGSVTFENGSNVPQMYIGPTGNVGIGTTSPSTPLHVRYSSSPNSGGNRNTVEDVLTLEATGYYPYAGYGMGINFQGEDYGNSAIRDYGKIQAVMSTGSDQNAAGDPGFSSHLGFWTNTGGASTTLSTEKMRITAAGNVGIGTNAPQAGFQVMGPPTATVPAAGSGAVGGAIFSADLNTYGMFIGSITSGVGYIQQQRTNTATYYGLALQPNGGNVGIGTTGPYFPLHVQGATGFNGEAKNNALLFDTASATTGTGGGLAFGGYSNGTGGDIYHFGNIQGIKENSTAGNYASAMLFSTRANGATPLEQMRISSAGNVGIGTTNPQSKLDINGNIVARGDLFFGTNPSNTLTTVPNNTDWHHIGYAGGAGYHITGSVQGDMTIGAIPGTGITFGTVVAGQTVPLSRMRIDATGAASFSGNLEVAGHNITGGNNYINVNSTNSSQLVYGMIVNATNTYTGAMALQAGGGSTSYGGGIVLYGHSHATYPGAVWIGQSASSTGGIMFGTSGNGPGTVWGRFDSSGDFTVNSNLIAPSVYYNVTGGSPNLVMYPGGIIQRTGSSLRYKNTVNDATHGLAELLTLRPVTYKGNNDGDTIFGGLIAEEVHDAGLTEFVQYGEEGEPDGLGYGNMVSLCIKAIQEQQAIIEALTARLEALERA